MLIIFRYCDLGCLERLVCGCINQQNICLAHQYRMIKPRTFGVSSTQRYVYPQAGYILQLNTQSAKYLVAFFGNLKKGNTLYHWLVDALIKYGIIITHEVASLTELW